MRLVDIASNVVAEPGMVDFMWNAVYVGVVCAIIVLLSAWFGVKDKRWRNRVCGGFLLLEVACFLMLSAWYAYFTSTGGEDWTWVMFWGMMPCVLALLTLVSLGAWALGSGVRKLFSKKEKNNSGAA